MHQHDDVPDGGILADPSRQLGDLFGGADLTADDDDAFLHLENEAMIEHFGATEDGAPDPILEREVVRVVVVRPKRSPLGDPSLRDVLEVTLLLRGAPTDPAEPGGCPVAKECATTPP